MYARNCTVADTLHTILLITM